jgi:hypothetical protein
MPTDVSYATAAPLPSRASLDVEAEAVAGAALDGAPTALVVDLDPVLGVRLATALNRRRAANVVIVLPRWPHAEAVLPTDGLIATLIEESTLVRRRVSARHVIFVLDGERSRSIRRSPIDPRVDNRYDLAVGDLPNLRQLRAAGVERVVKLSPNTSP